MNQIFICSICYKERQEIVIKESEDEMKEHMQEEHNISDYKNVEVGIRLGGGFAA